MTGNLSYHDHGTGHRLVARLDETLDPFGNPIPCNTFAAILPGISHACGVVKSGGGGVQAGDLVLLATLDGTLERPHRGVAREAALKETGAQ